MAERKLNINAPLLSVRRSSATSPSVSEAKRKILEKRHSLPNHISDFNLDELTEHATVPFNWEHIPGRRKGNGRSLTQPPPVEVSITPSPRLSPAKSTNSGELPLRKEGKAADKFRSSYKSNSFTGAVVKLDCDKDRKEENKVSNVNDDDVYSDALDRLYPAESYSINCSISGVSGLDNLDTKDSGTLSSDQQTRVFILSRFLPAAKAMTLQPSQYASKMQPVAVVERSREFNKSLRDERKPSLLKHVSDIVPHFGKCQEEEESEDEVEDCNGSTNISAKGCGLFSQLRLKNSLCLLNPVPGMKMRNQLPMPSAYESGKPNKGSQIRSYSSVPAVKKAWDAISKNKSSSRAASPERSELRRKWMSESNRFTFSGEFQLPGRLSPFRRSRGAAGVSPCLSKAQFPLRGVRLFGGSQNVQRNERRSQGNSRELQTQEVQKALDSTNPTIEKTLYIDTLSTVKLSCTNSKPVGATRKTDTVVDKLDKIEGIENSSTIESSPDTKNGEAMGRNMLDANSSTFSGVLRLRAQETNRELISTKQVQRLEDTDTISNMNNMQIVSMNDSRNGGVCPLLPPLPKSPTESWLWHALLEVSLRNSNRGSQTLSKRQASDRASSNTKWETIVKTWKFAS